MLLPEPPFDHNLFSVPVLLITTESPWQNVVAEPAEITAEGRASTVTAKAALKEEQPEAFVANTV
mgnify:CR=1 FL=1